MLLVLHVCNQYLGQWYSPRLAMYMTQFDSLISSSCYSVPSASNMIEPSQVSLWHVSHLCSNWTNTNGSVTTVYQCQIWHNRIQQHSIVICNYWLTKLWVVDGKCRVKVNGHHGTYLTCSSHWVVGHNKDVCPVRRPATNRHTLYHGWK